MWNETRYLSQIGYSQEEIEEYEKSWSKNIICFLSENQNHVTANMKCLSKDIDSELLIKLPVFYPEAFLLQPKLFSSYISLLKDRFPDEWTEIIKMQFYGYEGTDLLYANSNEFKDNILYQPYLETIGKRCENDIYIALNSLANPQKRIYKFIMMLNKDINLGITPYDFDRDILMVLEESKWELYENIISFFDEGLPIETIKYILLHNPLILLDSKIPLSKLPSELIE